MLYLMQMSVLAKYDICKLLDRIPPLIEGYNDLETQIQVNGFDISLRDIADLSSPGILPTENSGRAVSSLEPLEFGADGFIDLSPGPYLITHNEIVNLPTNVMALGRPRSSLLRSGVAVHTAVWDAGYSGRSQSLLVVYNPLGFRLQKNARVVQLVFFTLTGETDAYNGAYQGENT